MISLMIRIYISIYINECLPPSLDCHITKSMKERTTHVIFLVFAGFVLRNASIWVLKGSIIYFVIVIFVNGLGYLQLVAHTLSTTLSVRKLTNLVMLLLIVPIGNFGNITRVTLKRSVTSRARSKMKLKCRRPKREKH